MTTPPTDLLAVRKAKWLADQADRNAAKAAHPAGKRSGFHWPLFTAREATLTASQWRGAVTNLRDLARGYDAHAASYRGRADLAPHPDLGDVFHQLAHKVDEVAEWLRDEAFRLEGHADDAGAHEGDAS